MKKIIRTTRFEKDVKKMKKRGKSFGGFKELIITLAKGMPLAPEYKDHKLAGNYMGTREGGSTGRPSRASMGGRGARTGFRHRAAC